MKFNSQLTQVFNDEIKKKSIKKKTNKKNRVKKTFPKKKKKKFAFTTDTVKQEGRSHDVTKKRSMLSLHSKYIFLSPLRACVFFY